MLQRYFKTKRVRAPVKIQKWPHTLPCSGRRQGRIAGFLLRRRDGSAIYELILKTMVFLTLIVTAIYFFSAFTDYLNLGYACRRVVRDIEISGQVTGQTTALFEQLKEQTNIGDNAAMQVNARYHNAASKKIQLRETFTVKCSTQYRMQIFTPSFGDPVAITIPMAVTLTGMSEKFWK